MTKKQLTRTSKATTNESLAINGGTKTIDHYEGKTHPKVGTEEFMALAGLWGFKGTTLERMKKLLGKDPGISPQLTRYYNPRPSRVEMLEKLVRNIFGVKYALAVNSGTSALNAAYVAAGIGPGDEVIVPGYTFFASVAAVLTTKAIPVIAEIDDTLTLDPKDVEKKITSRTKAIIPVHMGGNACNMDAIMKIARKHKLRVIEDNAQACGGTYKGKYLGTIGHLGCFSLSSYKITGAGEAGLLLTDDEWLYTRAQNQHDTAACWRPEQYATSRHPGELFAGQNYRLSELEGAVNLVQIKKTSAQARRYNRNLLRICNALGKFPETRIRRSNDLQGDIGYRMVLMAATPKKALTLVDALQAEGVLAMGRGDKMTRDWHIYSYWEHVMTQQTATSEGCPFTCPYHKGSLPDYRPDMCPKTLDYLSRAIRIVVDQYWTARDCKRVAKAINKVCKVLG